MDILKTPRTVGKVTEKSCCLSKSRVDLHQNKEAEPFQSVLMNIYQSNTIRKDLSWIKRQAASVGPAALRTFSCSLSNIFFRLEDHVTMGNFLTPL